MKRCAHDGRSDLALSDHRLMSLPECHKGTWDRLLQSFLLLFEDEAPQLLHSCRPELRAAVPLLPVSQKLKSTFDPGLHFIA